MLLAKVRSFPRFVWRKSLNSPHVIGSLASKRRFVGAIAEPSPCGKMRRQTGSDLAHWPWRNGPHIVGRNNSYLGVSSPNTGRKTKLLKAVCGVRSSLRAGHTLDPWQIILRPTWWPSTGLCLCISPAGLERRRE